MPVESIVAAGEPRNPSENPFLERLFNITECITRAESVGRICEEAVSNLKLALGADRCSVLLFDEDGVMRFKAAIGLSDGYKAAVEGHSPWGPDDSDAQPILVADVLEDKALAPFLEVITGEGIRSLAFIPILRSGGVLGKFMVYFNQPHIFSGDEVWLCRTFAAQVAFAIERRRSEEALRKSDERMRDLMKAMPAALYTIDLDGRINYYNDAAAELWRHKPRLGVEKWFESFPLSWPNGKPLTLEEYPMAKLLQEATFISDKEVIVLRPDGSQRHVFPHPMPIYDGGGRLIGAMNIVVDITSRKEMELAVMESEDRFRVMADQAPVFIWMTDEHRKAIYVNKRWIDFTGAPLEEQLGDGWMQFVHPDDYDELEPCSVAFQEQKPFTIQFRLRRHDGEYRWVQDSGVPRFASDGTYMGVIGSAVDITERIKVEEELQRMNETLEERVVKRTKQVRSLASVLTLAEQRERQRISQVLHDDLQQLLYGQLLTVEMMRRSGSMINGHTNGNGQAIGNDAHSGSNGSNGKPLQNGKVDDFVDRIAQGLGQAIEVTRSLAVELNPPVLKTEGFVDALQWLARHMEDTHDMKIVLQVDASCTLLAGDTRTLLLQMVRELLFNVVKHSGKKEASVVVKKEKRNLKVSVQDRGKGFDLIEIRKRQNDFGGYGLFSIEERITLLGGGFDIKSGAASGTLISILLPMETIT